jgi:hypothetical protein
MGPQPFYDRGSHPLLWAGSRAASTQVTVSGILNCQKYYVPFIVYTLLTNVAAGCIIQLDGSLANRGLRVTHPKA